MKYEKTQQKEDFYKKLNIPQENNDKRIGLWGARPVPLGIKTYIKTT